MARSDSLVNGLLFGAAALTLTLTAPLTVAADEGSPGFVADRPDFTDSAQTVESLHLLAEFGLATEFNDVGQNLTFPDLLLRFGLVDYLELRAAAPLLTASFRGDDPEWNELDVGPLVVGLKFAMPLLDGALRLGLQPEFRIPLNEAHYDDLALGFGGRLLLAAELTDMINLGFNFGVHGTKLGASDADPEAEYLLSTNLGFEVSRTFTAFIEYYMTIDHDGDVLPVLDAGVAVLVADGFQLDGFLGVGLNHNAAALFLGLGAAWMVF